MTEAQTAVNLAYKLESLLRLASLATDGEQIAGKTFEQCGGGAVLDLAAEMALKIITDLEVAEQAQKRASGLCTSHT